MGGWGSREPASVNNPVTEPVQSVTRWALAQGEDSWRTFGDIDDFATLAKSPLWRMDLGTMCWDVDSAQSKLGYHGEDEGKTSHQATGNSVGRVHGRRCVVEPPSIAKYNIHGCDSWTVEGQQWPDIQHATPSFVPRYEALWGDDWFFQENVLPDRTILSDWVIQMQLESRRIGGRVYGIIHTGVNAHWPSVW